jgi:hypothetical protein
MKYMVLAMALLAVALAGATALDLSGLERTLWLVGLVGGAGGLLGGLAGNLIQQARG